MTAPGAAGRRSVAARLSGIGLLAAAVTARRTRPGGGTPNCAGSAATGDRLPRAEPPFW